MQLRISLNANRIERAYGGGNQFANTLETYLRSQGHRVFRRLVPQLDIILIVSSKWHPITTAYDIAAIADYLTLYPDTWVIHRINTCDEPRGVDLGNNQAILSANRLAEHTVFVSAFIQEIFYKHGLKKTIPHSIIRNAANEQIFHPAGLIEWRPGEKLKIVTHHWSSNYMKGFDIYERLDQLLEIPWFQERFEFTYIGNIPLGVNFRNTRIMPVLEGKELAHTLKQHHLYVTAARNEAGGNHYIEAMQSGLPVLFLQSGSLPEYCAPYGIEFTLVNFEAKLAEMSEQYSELRQRVLQYPYTGSQMSAQYEQLFLELVKQRRAHSASHRQWGNIVRFYCFTRPKRKLKRLYALVKAFVKECRM